MRFTKMHGAGNDFVVLDAVEQPLGIAPEDLPGLVSRLCDRHTGVGADGVMVRNIVLFGVLIYELIGPALTRIALTEAGDIQPKAEAVVSADD